MRVRKRLPKTITIEEEEVMKSKNEENIIKSEEFQNLIKKRNRISLIFMSLIAIIYFSFIMTIAFNKSLFYNNIGDTIITIGIPIGVLIIFSTVLLTLIYSSLISSKQDKERKLILKRYDNE